VSEEELVSETTLLLKCSWCQQGSYHGGKILIRGLN